MRILIIDYVTYLGHRNFNKIHVESLMRLGHFVHIVGRSSALISIKQTSDYDKTYLPQWANRTFPAKTISERLKQIALLFWIKNKLNVRNYDLVVFLAYDIMSLCLFRTDVPTLLVNHNNVFQLGSRTKFYLTKHLPANYFHIVLTEETKKQLSALIGKESVEYVPHGYVQDNGEAVRPDVLKEGEKFIFCPINSNFDAEQIKDIFSSNRFLKFMEENSIRLVIKSSIAGGVNHKNVVSLNKRIPEEEYRYLLRKAIAVILPYSSDFKYRSSGMLFECVAMGTPVIATRIAAMEMYLGLIQIKLFIDVGELVESIQYYMENPRRQVDATIFETDQYWNRILDNHLNKNEV